MRVASLMSAHPRARAVVSILMVLFTACAIRVYAQGQQPAPKPSDRQSEWEPCQACHEAVVNAFVRDAHGKSATFLNGDRAATCRACHGDAAKHLETPEAGNITNPAKLSPSLANASCLVCHQRDTARHSWQGSQHERAAVSCVSCHSAHHSQQPRTMLAKATNEELCFGCHGDKRKTFYQRSTHLFRTDQRQTKIDCSTCHDPHGGVSTTQLRATSTNDLCYGCHAEMRGPFLWEHAPVRENCLTCHTPHGSNNPKLMNARVNLVCQQCHISALARHQTLAGRPTDIWVINRACVNCHTLIHGSNHPSGKTFAR